VRYLPRTPLLQTVCSHGFVSEQSSMPMTDLWPAQRALSGK
jgi:hypothetical protein